jgi:hypothetical protein
MVFFVLILFYLLKSGPWRRAFPVLLESTIWLRENLRLSRVCCSDLRMLCLFKMKLSFVRDMYRIHGVVFKPSMRNPSTSAYFIDSGALSMHISTFCCDLVYLLEDHFVQHTGSAMNRSPIWWNPLWSGSLCPTRAWNSRKHSFGNVKFCGDHFLDLKVVQMQLFHGGCN